MTTYGYTGGTLTSITNALGEVTGCTPDAVGRPSLVTYADPLGATLGTVEYGYDNNSRVETIKVGSPASPRRKLSSPPMDTMRTAI